MKRILFFLLTLFISEYSIAQCSVDLGIDTAYVCQGDSVQFDAGSSWTTYLWSDGQTNSSIYETSSNVVSIMVTDGTGCVAYDTVLVVGVVPQVSASENVICFEQEVDLMAQLFAEYDTIGSLADTLQLPDGNGVNYQTTVTVTDFEAGTTVEDVFDELSLCVTMEHSWLGDLEMMLTCPSGDTLVIFDSYTNPNNGLFPGGFGGGGTFLGDPIDDTNLEFGDGRNYCFSDLAEWGTLGEEHESENFIELDTLLGNNEVGFSMAPGLYKPEWDFENLMGCPLNGDWTITIRDNLFADDGFIMFWGIEATSELDDVSYTWSTTETTQMITVEPTETQTYWADMTIGNTTCSDSTILQYSFNPPTFTVTENPMSCDSVGGSVEIEITGGLAVQSIWSANNLINLDLGVHEFTMVDTAGCEHTVEAEIIYEDNPWPELEFLIDDAGCNASNGSAWIVPAGPNGPYSLEWYGENHLALSSGTHSVTIIDGNTCSFDTTVTIEVDFGNIEGIIGTTMVFPGQEFTYSVPFSECLVYDWSIDEGTIISGQGTNEVLVTWNNSVSGWIAVSIDETRDFSADLILYVGTSTGIDSPEIELAFAPNPFNDVVSISANQVVKQIDVFDFAGRNVLSVQPQTQAFQLDLTSLDAGSFILKATTEAGASSKLIFKN